MKAVDLQRIAKDQIVAQPITLHPLAELDEAGAESTPLSAEVAFRVGDTIRIVSESMGTIVAYKNARRRPDYGLPPYIFAGDEIQNIMVQE